MSTSEAETRARAMGWVPQDKYHGKNPWLPAEDFLKKGDEIMPILQANNRVLTERLSGAEARLAETQQLLRTAQEAIEGLKEINTETAKKAVKDKKTEVLAAIVEAKRAGNVESEVALTDQLTDLNASLREPAAAKPTPKTTDTSTQGPEVSSEARAWMAENPWFGPDKRRTGYAMGLSNEWLGQGKKTGTKEFFEFVDQEMSKQFDQNAGRRNGGSKVGGTNNDGGDGGGDSGGGKTFADMPQEAKDACERFAAKVVGPGRVYKDKEAHRKAYAEKYWSQQ